MKRPQGSEVSLNMEAILSGRTIRGTVEGDSIPDIVILQLIEPYKRGCFPFDRGIKFYPLDQINKAAEDSEKGKVLKLGLRP